MHMHVDDRRRKLSVLGCSYYRQDDDEEESGNSLQVTTSRISDSSAGIAHQSGSTLFSVEVRGPGENVPYFDQPRGDPDHKEIVKDEYQPRLSTA
jgi:hypothetical protein